MIHFDVPQYPKPIHKPWTNIPWIDRNGVLRVAPPRTKLGKSGAGRNARGVCLHKRTKSAKRAKRQKPPQVGPKPLQAGPFIDPSRMPGSRKDARKT